MFLTESEAIENPLIAAGYDAARGFIFAKLMALAGFIETSWRGPSR